MDLHIGLGYHLIWSLDGVRELVLSDTGNWTHLSYEIEENDELFSSVEQLRPLYSKTAQAGFFIDISCSISDWLELIKANSAT